MQYSVESEVLDKVHPLWPNQKVYYIYDLLRRVRKNPFTIYTSRKAAEDRLIEGRHV
jgi:hypothetical protein